VNAGGSVTAVAGHLARLCTEALADWCVLTVVGDSGSIVDAVAHTDPAREDDLRALVAAAPYDAASVSGTGAVVRSGHMEVVPRTIEPHAGDDEMRRLLTRLGDGSQVIVPLRGTSRIVGALRLARIGATFSAAEIASIRDITGRMGVAIESRLTHDRHRDAVMALQRSLLPGVLPDIAGAELASGYWPASDEFDIGGDFFDVIDLGPERWGILVGDISGKGIEAAAMTGIARHTARAAARHGLEPIEVLRWIHDAFVEQRETMTSYCSAVYGVLEAVDDTFRFTFTIGGHPLPIMRPAHGPARYVGGTGTVLGLIEPIELTASEVILSPGDWLVLYTDGVTDVPTPDAIDEHELLGLVDMACRDSPETALASLGQMLKTRYGGVANRDDTALVIIRCAEAGPSTTVRVGEPGR
jgi:serine phosphatase RsbU (regulator of sigma subunit)